MNNDSNIELIVNWKEGICMHVPYSEFVIVSIGILVLAIAFCFVGRGFRQFAKGILELINAKK